MASLLNALIGEYRIVESLGAGGMGEVYKAVHTHLGRTIAIKVLSPDLTDGPALARFYGEANIQARLRHPGVAEYLGFYEYQGRPCILMEYVDGETLASAIRKRGPFPAAEGVRIVREIAAIAAHFHGEGLVHRDLKANNVKIDSAGRVRILDFGIARYQCSDRMTRIGAVIGTPEALSPEQVRGEPATEATDVWQLGVLFYELLTGHAAFQSSNTLDLYTRILSAEFLPVKQWRPDLPGGLEEIVGCCLQKSPAKRYPSAAELHTALCSWEAKQSGAVPKPAATRAGEAPRWSPRPAMSFVLGFLRDKVGRPAAAQVSSAVHRAVPLYWNAALGLVLGIALLLGLLAIVRERRLEPPKPPPDATAPVAHLAVAADLKTVTVDTADGTAQVLVAGKLVGSTPFRVQARSGESVELVLRRAGFKDLLVQFEVTERHDYTYTLQPLKEY
jgi:eukaryotic-like serine/threonine-protein kinase